MLKWNVKELILKNRKKIYSPIYGIFGSLGFICFLEWMIMVTFHETSKYPNRYPMCIAFGILSLIICIITFICNIETLMKEKNRIKYILLELLFTVIIFILFFFIFSFIDENI